MPQYSIDPELRQPAYLQLYNQIREDITNGICPFQSKLPSKRYLASETGTSVITVQHAYDLLADEGYIESRERSGYYVIYKENELFPVASAADDFSSSDGTASEPVDAAELHEISDIPIRGPIVTPEQEQFPFNTLARKARKVLSEYGESLLVRSPNSGTVLLREAIAQYLARSRRMNVAPDQIVIGSGAEYLYGLIVQLLGRDRVYAVEDPSYNMIQRVYLSQGVTLDRLPMGTDGVRTDALWNSSASVLHVTPFRSFPTMITASASKRHEYISWVGEDNRFIIEDDYDSEFSPSSKAEDTLFSLSSNERVIYVNTFSKTVAPSIRAGFMVLPASLVSLYQSRCGFMSCSVPVLEQVLLEELLTSGDFVRHINKVRRSRRRSSPV